MSGRESKAWCPWKVSHDANQSTSKEKKLHEMPNIAANRPSCVHALYISKDD